MAKQTEPPPVLSTARLRLRQFRTEDIEAIHECFADHDAMRFWDRPAHTKRIETEKVVRESIDCDPRHFQSWAVADAETDCCLGLVNYHDRHTDFRRVSIGYMINPMLHGRGFATEAVSALVTYCFGPLGAHRIQAFIDPRNSASRKLVENLGFRNEGLLRDNLRVGEVWRSDMIYGLLLPDLKRT